jgi:hypothetical protein
MILVLANHETFKKGRHQLESHRSNIRFPHAAGRRLTGCRARRTLVDPHQPCSGARGYLIRTIVGISA